VSFPRGLALEVDIYARRFTHDEIRGLLAFYSTDLGKKVVMTLPGVVPESAAVGEAWATVRMPTVTVTLRERLRADGFVK
jgi:hypothetical protein